MSLRWCPILFLLLSYWSTARAEINYDSDRKVWVLQAGQVTYAMGVNERGELQPIYWGAQVKSNADFSTPHSRPEVASFDLTSTTTPQEYPGWGAEFYNEPALKATYADGNRDVVLHFVSSAHRWRYSGDPAERYRLIAPGSSLLPHLRRSGHHPEVVTD